MVEGIWPDGRRPFFLWCRQSATRASSSRNVSLTHARWKEGEGRENRDRVPVRCTACGQRQSKRATRTRSPYMVIAVAVGGAVLEGRREYHRVGSRVKDQLGASGTDRPE